MKDVTQDEIGNIIADAMCSNIKVSKTTWFDGETYYKVGKDEYHIVEGKNHETLD